MLGRLKPKVLFVCIGNSCRSQMAEGFSRSMAGDKIEVYSAGTSPSGTVSLSALEIMNEIGINISKQFSKGLAQIPQEKYDAIVTMGCGDACPQLPAEERFDWQIPDPVGKDHETFRNVRNQIQNEVKALLKKIKVIS